MVKTGAIIVIWTWADVVPNHFRSGQFADLDNKEVQRNTCNVHLILAQQTLWEG